MNSPDQTDIFSRDEGDNWFFRNRDHLTTSRSDDPTLAMVERLHALGGRVDAICDLGCANGWRLAALGQAYPEAARLAGSDISEAAVIQGRRAWPELELAIGSLDRPGLAGQFDVVIVSFVFHWVARERLARSVAAIDELVTEGGALIIADFLPDRPCARTYHHRTDVALFTYKQNYADCFLGLGLYEQLEQSIYSHSHEGEAVDPEDRAVCALLRKNLTLYERA